MQCPQIEPKERRGAMPLQKCKVKKEPESWLRKVLIIPYQIYGWLVYIPCLLINTIFLGTMALITSKVFNQRVGFHSGTIWGWLMCKLNFTWVKVKGKRHIDPKQSYVIMANHLSHFDILAIYGHWGRQFRWVMKQELRKVWGLGWGCEAIGHIFIDRSNREAAIASLNKAKPKLKNGVSIMFFPEGTRSRDGRMQKFKKGGFMMALDMGLPILPVSISGSHRVLPGKVLKIFPGKITITVHPPIDVMQYGKERRDELMADVRTVIASGLTPWEKGE